MIFTDPPYNVKIDGNVTGLGANRHREFAMASGEMTDAEFQNFLLNAFVLLLATQWTDLSTTSAWTGAIPVNCWRQAVWSIPDKKHLRLGKIQCRHGYALPQPTRVRFRV